MGLGQVLPFREPRSHSCVHRTHSGGWALVEDKLSASVYSINLHIIFSLYLIRHARLA